MLIVTMKQRKIKGSYFSLFIALSIIVIIVFSSILSVSSQTNVGYYNDFESSESLASEGFDFMYSSNTTNASMTKSTTSAYNGSYGLLMESIPEQGTADILKQLSLNIADGNYLSFEVNQVAGPTTIRIQLANKTFAIFLDIGSDPHINWEPGTYISNTGAVFPIGIWTLKQYNLTNLLEKAINLSDSPIHSFVPTTIADIHIFQDGNGQTSIFYLDDLRFSPSPITIDSQSSSPTSSSLANESSTSQTQFRTIVTASTDGFQFETVVFMCLALVVVHRIKTSKK